MRDLMIKCRELIKFKVLRPMLLGIGGAISRWSVVGDHPLYSKENFEWANVLEENYQIIKKELLSILPRRSNFPNLQDIQQEQYVLNTDNNWKTFFLYGFGEKATLNCSLCPCTTALIEKIPGMKTAFFSILSPHKHIPAHKGIYKGIIRSHLGLIIPGNGEQCRMRIEDQYVYWKEGEVVIFDDTREHEVWNDSGEVRVVLLVDVTRPFRNFFGRVNDTVIRLIGNSSYVKEASENHRKWESSFHTK